MAFRKAESLAATSGYFNYLARVKEHEERQKLPPQRPKPTEYEAAVQSMDHEFLMEQARRMNEHQAAANEEEARAIAEYERMQPSDDMRTLHNQMTEAKLRALIKKEKTKIERAEEKVFLRKKNAMQNVRPIGHSKAWKPTKDVLRQPLSEVRHPSKQQRVSEYNGTKETYYINRHVLGGETNAGITAYKPVMPRPVAQHQPQ